MPCPDVENLCLPYIAREKPVPLGELAGEQISRCIDVDHAGSRAATLSQFPYHF